MTKLLVIAFAAMVTMAWENPPPSMTRYSGKLTVISVPLAQITNYCRGSGRAWACSFRYARSCRVYLPSDQSPEIIASLRAHELAHCNGWGH